VGRRHCRFALRPMVWAAAVAELLKAILARKLPSARAQTSTARLPLIYEQSRRGGGVIQRCSGRLLHIGAWAGTPPASALHQEAAPPLPLGRRAISSAGKVASRAAEPAFSGCREGRLPPRAAVVQAWVKEGNRRPQGVLGVVRGQWFAYARDRGSAGRRFRARTLASCDWGSTGRGKAINAIGDGVGGREHAAPDAVMRWLCLAALRPGRWIGG
jgi:hypothetical protein